MKSDIACNKRNKDPVFLLGIGCQKGGTTWMHDYLSKHPQVELGFKKEYHVFDALYVSECKQRYYKEVLKRGRKIILDEQFNQEAQSVVKELGFLVNPEEYFNYFEYLYLASNKVSVVGDITPSYSALPRTAFSYIQRNLIKRKFSPKLVFIMRDPVERCWSAARMMRRQKIDKDPGHKFTQSEDQDVLWYSLKKGAEIRTRYNRTLKNVFDVFDSADVFVSFYETLFSEEEIRRLSSFLDIDYISPNLAVRKGASPKTGALTSGTIRRIADHYSDVYKWAFDQYGTTFIKGIWPNATYI